MQSFSGRETGVARNLRWTETCEPRRVRASTLGATVFCRIADLRTVQQPRDQRPESVAEAARATRRASKQLAQNTSPNDSDEKLTCSPARVATTATARVYQSSRPHSLLARFGCWRHTDPRDKIQSARSEALRSSNNTPRASLVHACGTVCGTLVGLRSGNTQRMSSVGHHGKLQTEP